MWGAVIGDLAGSIYEYEQLKKVIKEEKPDVIYHLAGQVAMTTSIANPRLDFETNVLGSFNVLEAVRQFSPETVIVYCKGNALPASDVNP